MREAALLTWHAFELLEQDSQLFSDRQITDSLVLPVGQQGVPFELDQHQLHYVQVSTFCGVVHRSPPENEICNIWRRLVV